MCMHTAHFQSCCLKTAPCCFYTQLPAMLMRTIRLKWKIRVDAWKNELTDSFICQCISFYKNIWSRLSDAIRYSSSNISNAMMKQFSDFWEKAHLFLMQVKVCIRSSLVNFFMNDFSVYKILVWWTSEWKFWRREKKSRSLEYKQQIPEWASTHKRCAS